MSRGQRRRHGRCVIANTAVNTPTDSAGNAWQIGTNNTLTGNVGRMKIHWLVARNNAGLPNGSTITANYGGTTGIKLAAVACIAGAIMQGPVLESEATPTTGSSTSPSLSLTAPTMSPAQIVVCSYLVVSGSGDTFTNTSGFSPLTQVANSSALNWEYKITSDFSTQTCAPTLGTLRTWGANGRSMVQTQGSRALLGVGQ
jgi:hypothetical protein